MSDAAIGRVVVVGSCNVDLVAPVERHPRPGETVLGGDLRRFAGGKGANQAVAARAAGADVAMVAVVGDDDGGRSYVRRLESLGIDTSGVLVDPDRPTGHALIVVDEAGENSIVVSPGANASPVWERLAGGPASDGIGGVATDAAGGERLAVAGAERVLDSLGPGDVVLLQLEIPLPAVAGIARRAAAAGARVVLNLAPFAPVPAGVVALADPVIVNEHEARLLADSDLLPESIVTTFGAAGAAWNLERRTAPLVPPDEVVDTTGAGDAFCGALAASLVTGADPARALRAALRAGSGAVRHAGAQSDGAL